MTLTENMDDFFNTDEFSEEITYTPAGGSPTTIEAIVNTDFPRQEDYDRGVRFAIAELTVHSSQVTNINGRDRYTFQGYEWQIAGEGYQVSGDFITVHLVRLLTD